jgi:hypothetical protein
MSPVAIFVAAAFLITLCAVAMGRWLRRRSDAEPAARDEHADWMHEVTRAATGLTDLPRVDL